MKIGDLNVSKFSQEGLCFTQTGTPYYASPQIWKDQPYGAKSDIWSLGCVIYQMICLRPPFSGDGMEELYKSVTKGIYSRIPSNYYSRHYLVQGYFFVLFQVLNFSELNHRSELREINGMINQESITRFSSTHLFSCKSLTK